MKKILVLTLVLLLPFVLSAQGNNQKKWQQNLQKRNEVVIQNLQNMSRYYNMATSTEVKEKITRSIDMEVERWCMSNTPKIISFQQRQQVMQTGQKGKKANNSFSKKDMAKVKQELIAEIKNGKIPDIMLETVSPKFATQIKQSAEMQTDKQ